MENQVPPARNGEFQHKLTRLIFIREATRLALRRRWVRLIIRETLTVALYIIFWKYAWVRWSLYVVAPLILLNLGLLSILTWALPRKIEALQNALNDRGETSE